MAKALMLAMVCSAVLLPNGTRAQQLDYASRQRMTAEVAVLSDPLAAEAQAANAQAIMTSVGLTLDPPAFVDVTIKPFVPDGKAVLELVDIRLLLTQIAIQTGARDHLALLRAQGDRDHDVILLRGGMADLNDLLALSKGGPAQDFIQTTADGIVLARPLAIWSDAGLGLATQDRLILDLASGSFLVNLGWLDIAGGHISGSSGHNSAEPGFRPFIMTAGQGTFTAHDAGFAALGFGSAAAFGGISVSNNGLVASSLPSSLTHSTLHDVGTVGFIGTKNAVIGQNHIAASAGTAVLVSAARNTIVASNQFALLSGPQAIRVTAESFAVQIVGNLLSGGPRMGILIDRDSEAITLADNLVTGSLKTGISVDTATCLTITGNLVASNGGAGINLADTDGTIAADNAILFNQGSGVLIRDQADTASVLLSGNVFIDNRDGLRGATPGHLELANNKLDGQIPRVFAGDLSRLTAAWLRDRSTPLYASAAASPAAPCPPPGDG